MLNIFANSFMTASRQQPAKPDHIYNHWGRRTRYDDRRSAELAFQKEGMGRD